MASWTELLTTKWLEIDGKYLRCNSKCMVVLVTQIRRHFKAVRDLFLKISDHGLKTQGFHHNYVLMLIGTSMQDNLVLLQHISRGLLAWQLIHRSQGEHSSLGNGKCPGQDEVSHLLEITINRELGYKIILHVLHCYEPILQKTKASLHIFKSQRCQVFVLSQKLILICLVYIEKG